MYQKQMKCKHAEIEMRNEKMKKGKRQIEHAKNRLLFKKSFYDKFIFVCT